MRAALRELGITRAARLPSPWRAHGACRRRGTRRAALGLPRQAAPAPAASPSRGAPAVACAAWCAGALAVPLGAAGRLLRARGVPLARRRPAHCRPPRCWPADAAPLTRWPRRWRRAVSAAGGGPVSAAPRRAAAARPERWTALGGPHLRPGCQPPGVACEARVRGLAARCSLRSLAKVALPPQQSADRSARPFGKATAAGRAAPASCWGGSHCLEAGGLPPAPPGARIPHEQPHAGTEIPSTAPAGSCLPSSHHARAVQGRRALRGCLAAPGEVAGGGPSLRPRVIARQDLATRGPAGGGGDQPGPVARAVARPSWAGG